MTAMYCLPPAVNDTGKPCTDVPSRVCQSDLPGLHVERAEAAIEVADETRRRPPVDSTAGQERRALLVAPHLLHRRHVVGGELADVAVAARHLEEAAIGVRCRRRLRAVQPARPDISMHDWLSGMISALVGW